MVMSNDFERLFKLQTMVGKLVLDGKRNPRTVAYALQKIIEEEQQKFTLLADLGTITVPADYVHATRLATFEKQNRIKFWGYDENITDTNFSNPSRILKAGDKLHVRAYGHAVKDTSTSEERMEFLRMQRAVFVGAQGASLAFEQKRQELPKGKWYASFDEPDRLWVDADGRPRVPGVHAFEDGAFNFNLGYFEEPWDDNYAFLSFSDVPLET
jgi:hypothetical protein